MGLGAPKKRTKLSNDPNNTNWARNTANYGHKILASQGWQPGQYLGAENANHASHYTAANASHIRVMLREDNLGLGAGRGTSNAETFGLSTLSGIFGRLNGKTEDEVQKVQETQRDLGLRTWQERKYGFMNFVRGGLLVGDKMKEPEGEGAGAELKVQAVPSQAAGLESQKKRKLEDVDSTIDARASKKKSKVEAGTEEQSSSRSKKREKGKDHGETLSDGEPEDERATKRKKSKKHSKDVEPEDESHNSAKSKKRSKSGSKGDAANDDKARLKEEKRARKEEKRRRKEAKRQLKDSKGSKSKSKDRSEDQSAESSENEAETAAVTVVAPAAPPQALAFGGSRHAVRQRYIQQKRMASMNPQAMQEILMLKASG